MEKLTLVFIALVAVWSPSALCFAPSGPFGVRETQNRPLTISSMSTITESSLAQSGPSFEDRMRDIVLAGSRRKKQKRPSAHGHRPPNLKIVHTLDEYKDVVGTETNRIVAVRFFAQWCKACKAMAPLFYRMANNCPNVLFVEVPVNESNANLHQGLGVPVLPFGHIYLPNGGLVEEQSISRKNIRTFAKKLQSYISGFCELENMETSSPYPEPVSAKQVAR